jgi:Ca-activated chloride channel family protein
MARPQWLARGADTEPRRNVVFAIDVSGSMRALDYQADGRRISRLDMVRRALKRFLGQARDLRVALVVFADGALPFMPLTSDLPLAAAMTDEIDHSLAGERTALGDALAQSIRRMQSIEGKRGSRALVLMTDGIGTAGAVPPEAAAALAREQGIRIYTVGIGSEGKVPFPLTSTQDLMYTELPLGEELLRRIAADTGGAYFRIREAADMDGVLGRIDALERSEAPAAINGEDWYWLPAVTGLVLLLLSERRAAGPLPA